MPDVIALRCFGTKHGEDYYAYCIDLDLVVVGSSVDEARRALEFEIKQYWDVIAAMGYPAHLVRRKSPLSIRLQYQMIRLRCAVSGTRQVSIPKEKRTKGKCQLRGGKICKTNGDDYALFDLKCRPTVPA